MPTAADAQSTSVENDAGKSVMNVRSGHLARLTRLTREIEEAIKDYSNVELVLELQGKVGSALTKFRDSSREYVKSLTEASDIEKEIDIVKKHDEAKKALDVHIDGWLQEAQNEPRSGSRAGSQQSSATQEKERNRRFLELELNQLIRRQEANREVEEVERQSRQKDMERQERQRRKKEERARERDLLEAKERLEVAQLEEELASASDVSNLSLSQGDPNRAVKFALSPECVKSSTSDPEPETPPQIQIPSDRSESHQPTRTLPLRAPANVPPPHQHPNFPHVVQIGCNVGPTLSETTPTPFRRCPTSPFYGNNEARYASGSSYRNVPENYIAPNIHQQSYTNYQQRSNWYGDRYQHNPSDFMPHYSPVNNNINHQPVNQIIASLGEMANAFKLGSDLPKPELDAFTGDPRDFCKFRNAFKTIVESKTHDSRVRLHYLIQYCSGIAKKAIEHCAMFPDPVSGLSEAKSILANTFGQPYDIVQAYKNPITKSPYIKSHDVQGLVNLSVEMRKCHLALSQLGFSSDINNSETLLKIVWKLPYHLQTKWVARANEIHRCRRDPNFSDLTEFIRESASTANTFYGRNIRRDRFETHGNNASRPTRNAPPQFRTTMAMTSTSGNKLPTHPHCLYCSNKNHRLVDCFKFQALVVSERYKFASVERICHNCLLVGHLALGCLERACCTQTGCRKKHHTLFHSTHTSTSADVNMICTGDDDGVPEEEIETETTLQELVDHMPDDEIEEEQDELDFTVHLASSTRRACLHVIPVHVRGNGKEYLTHALLDTGSDVTLCTRKLINTLQLKGKPAVYSIKTINKPTESKKGLEVSLDVVSLDNLERITLPKVWTVDNIPITRNNIPHMDDVQSWPHLRGIEFPRLPNQDVDLLIGGDTPEAFWALEQRMGARKEPYAIRTLLGWTLMGPLKTRPSSPSNAHYVCTEELASQQIRSLWDAEFEDINILGKQEMSKDDCQAVELVEKSLTTTSSNNYELRLPWKDSNDTLFGNIGMALSRLRSLKRRIGRDNNLLQQYTKCVEGYIQKGYARIVPHDEVQMNGQQYWYLPHHPVINAEKNKLRVVFDCAATHNGISLNKSLLSGPDVTSSLLGVLLRFRKDFVALVGDIEAMFHQIKMNRTDWDKLSFLWWKDGDISSKPITCQMTVHLFGATSSPFCANYCLRRTASDNEDEFDDDVIATVNRSFYVDDCLTSVKTVDGAKRLRTQLTSLLELGGFRITKWTSNNKEVIESIPKEERSPSINALDLEFSTLPVERALGVTWDAERDTIGFKCRTKQHPSTKRGVLSAISSVYDPMGMLAPFILRGKLILREITRKNLGWDDPLPENLVKLWNQWLRDLPCLSWVNVPRCVKPAHFQKIISAQLHNFCDASSQGYGVVTYLRLKDTIEHIAVSFLLGKSRLAPIKSVTIPRLELSAACLAVKINGFIRTEIDMDITSTRYWTDSKTVIKYLNNRTKRFHTFVSNRITTIQSGSELHEWGYINSKENPADEASRGMVPKEFKGHCRWLLGPQFLSSPESEWPSYGIDLSIDKGDPEVKREEVQTHLVVETEVEPLQGFINYYSDWSRLLRASAWLIRFTQFISKPKAYKFQQYLSAQEIDGAQQRIISYVQKEKFGAMINGDGSLNGKNIPKSLKKLQPFIKEGVLRVGGRITRAPVNFDLRHPIIIPRGHIANLIVRHYHHLNGHVGSSHTWTVVRQTFWIINGGTAVRSVIGNCLQCKKRNAKIGEQLMADLPVARVTPNKPPFHSTGVDFFGPLLVKQGRSTPKRYGCLFTCLACRAIHLEVASDLSSASFINALRRFISRRGCPVEIYSDNGTNFVGAEKELRVAAEFLAGNEVQSFSTTRRIQWYFNTPRAPHMGGAWERMIGMVKRISKCILTKQLITDESLHTILLEIENIVNSRPLLPITLDPQGEEPLTPNHLLLLSSGTQNLGEFHKNDNYAVRRWRQVQYLAQQFWRRWVAEYLPLLQKRDKWNRVLEDMRIGDVILVAEDSVPRGRWPMGKILETYPGKDGKVRQVKIKTQSGTFVRPITKLCRLDLK